MPEHLGFADGGVDTCFSGEKFSGHREIPWEAVRQVNRKGSMWSQGGGLQLLIDCPAGLLWS